MTTDPSPAPDTPRPEYEFTPAQSRTLDQLGGNLLFAGWFIVIAVVTFHLVLLFRWAVEGVPMYDRFRLWYVVWPLLLLAGSWQFIVTGLAFRRVARTEGSDIALLMMGLEGLNTAFNWLTIVPKVWLVLLPIALLVGAILALVHWLGY
jgi:hypothetical protein